MVSGHGLFSCRRSKLETMRELGFLTRLPGFEPGTRGLEVRRSVH